MARETGSSFVGDLRLEDRGAFYNLPTARIIGVEYCVQEGQGECIWIEWGYSILRSIGGKWMFDERNTILELFMEPEVCEI
ncbi:MAG: hypothetical protein GX251_03410 [Firmicutes bacterium]|nr:hypothetical protein [Bacillota bacterium]